MSYVDTTKKCGSSEFILTVAEFCTLLVILILMLITTVVLAVMMYIYRRKLVQLSKDLSNIKVIGSEIPPIVVSHSSMDVSLLSINKLNDEEKISKNSALGLTNLGNESSKHEAAIAENTEENLTLSTKARKIYKSMKSTPSSHQIILQEQMKKICEDALAKKQNKRSELNSSIDDVNELLNEFKNENKVSTSTERDKCASEPHLEIYANSPSNLPIYDSVVGNKNIVIEDYDTKYLLPISTEMTLEPEYINAQYRRN